MNHPQTTHQVTRSRFFAVATVGAFLIAISEMVFMASPFAAYFYSAFSPVLKWTENHSYLMWLTDFFVPHLSTPASAWFGSLLKLPRYLTFVGIASFATHAGYLYWMKFVRKRVATGLLYRYVRHPQYLSFAVAGLGLVFYWPRFINLLLFFVMLIGSYALARTEEERVQRQHGRFPRVRRSARSRGDLRGHPRFLQAEHGLEERLLAGEVVINGTARHPARRRHVLQRGPAVPALGEQCGRLFQQRGPGGRRVHLAAALDLGHTLRIHTQSM